MQRARGANADYVLHAVEVEELIGIDAYGGHAHAGSHHGNALALIKTRVALNAANVVHEHRVLKEIIGDELCPFGIAGHQYGLCEITELCGDMGSGNGHILPP